MADLDDFDTQIQSDEIIPAGWEVDLGDDDWGDDVDDISSYMMPAYLDEDF